MKQGFLFVLIAMILSCNNTASDAVILAPTYKKDLEAYRLKMDHDRKKGYLQLTGLFKFKDSINGFGRDTSNAFQLDIERLPKTIGTFKKLNKKLIQFMASDSVFVMDAKEYKLTSMMLILDDNGNSDPLFYNDLKWQIITRAKGPYLRVWDAKNPAIDNFKGFQHYPLASNFILEAQFTYYPLPKSEDVKSQLGVQATTNFIGYATFNYLGKSHKLDIGGNGFTMVGDNTTGESTYGGGRYVYLDLPEKNGPVTIDFNKLYNPPCSFSEFTTCLYPPQQNHLPFKIEAGEKIVRNN
jgi:hypothetical protein